MYARHMLRVCTITLRDLIRVSAEIHEPNDWARRFAYTNMHTYMQMHYMYIRVWISCVGMGTCTNKKPHTSPESAPAASCASTCNRLYVCHTLYAYVHACAHPHWMPLTHSLCAYDYCVRMYVIHTRATGCEYQEAFVSKPVLLCVKCWVAVHACAHKYPRMSFMHTFVSIVAVFLFLFSPSSTCPLQSIHTWNNTAQHTWPPHAHQKHRHHSRTSRYISLLLHTHINTHVHEDTAYLTTYTYQKRKRHLSQTSRCMYTS